MEEYEQRSNGPRCKHGEEAVVKTSGPQTKNPGRQFFACPRGPQDKGGCGFFLWNGTMPVAKPPDMFPASFNANKKRQWEEPQQFAQGSPQRSSLSAMPVFSQPAPQTPSNDFSLVVLEGRLRALESRDTEQLESLTEAVAGMQEDLARLIVLFTELTKTLSTKAN